MATMITAEEARRRIHQAGELALIDVREAGEFGEGHLLFAAPCPYSRLEIDFPRLVPRKGVPVILVDGGDGVGERAARRLDGLGYTDVVLLEGGVDAWAAADYTIYKGINVPSKLLGELAEHVHKPKMISAETLAEWQTSGRHFRFFDTRPPPEHAKMRVPGSVCLPNGELAHRFAAAVVDEREPVLITCAGRTRGLIGAAGLRVAGIRNPVYALENGTQGWALAGSDLERGYKADPYPALDDAAREDSARRARALCLEDGIEIMDARKVAALMSDSGRTTHLLDVRSADEVKDDPIAAAAHALGGQLVQSTDQWIGMRRSRIVLACDTGLRSALAGYWLKRLGYEVYVHTISADTYKLAAPGSGGVPATPVLIAATNAAQLVESGSGVLVDLRASAAFRNAHAAQAGWSIRPHLDRLADITGKTVCLFADDPRIAGVAALDLTETGAKEVVLVDGGFAAWEQAGLNVVRSDTSPEPAEAIDFLLFVHDRHEGNLEASRQYLAWEQGLMAQTDEQERAEFLI